MRISTKSRITAGLFLALMLLPMSTSAQNSMVDLNIMSSAYNMAYAVNELDQVAGAGYQSFFFGFVWDRAPRPGCTC